jgi:hypothetical protein
MNDSKLIDDFSKKWSDGEIEKFVPMEMHTRSGKRFVCRAYIPDEGNIIAIHMPVEYDITPDGIAYKKLFSSSDSSMFAFPSEHFESMANMNNKWKHFYDFHMKKAYFIDLIGDVDNSEEDDYETVGIDLPIGNDDPEGTLH